MTTSARQPAAEYRQALVERIDSLSTELDRARDACLVLLDVDTCPNDKSAALVELVEAGSEAIFEIARLLPMLERVPSGRGS